MAEPALLGRRFTGGRTRQRLTAVATLVGAVILVPAGFLGYTGIESAQQTAVHSTAIAETQGIVGLLRGATLPVNYQGDLPFQVSTRDGTILASPSDLSDFQRSGAIGRDSWDPPPTVENGFSSRETVVRFQTDGPTSNRLDGLQLSTIDTYTPLSTAQASAAGLPSGTIARVLVFLTPTDTNGLLENTRTLITIAVPSALTVLAIAVWITVGSALSPIARMSRRVKTITATRLDERIPVPHTGDEVQELAITLNSLLNRLQQNDANQRAFLGDAAHELRSPITSLLTTLEVADRYPKAVDWSNTLAASMRQARRLQLLSDDLLLLTSLEAAHNGEGANVDFGEVITSLIDSARTSHPINLDLVPGIIVAGHRRDLERLVQNLLDNADRHASTRVEIALSLQNRSGARLTVQNDGPPIPSGSEERIFDRLVRLDTARDSAAGGSGLGLAIARQIAHNHNARLVAVPRSEGAEFQLDIPTSVPPAMTA